MRMTFWTEQFNIILQNESLVENVIHKAFSLYSYVRNQDIFRSSELIFCNSAINLSAGLENI